MATAAIFAVVFFALVASQTAPAQADEGATAEQVGGNFIYNPSADLTGFAVAGVSWKTNPAAQVSVQIRTRVAGELTPWEPIELEDSNDRAPRGASAPVTAGSATWLEALVTSSAPLEDLKISTFDADSLGREIEAQQPPRQGVQTGAITIHPRAQWAADEAFTNSEWPANQWQVHFAGAIVHHTAGSNTYTCDQVPGIIKAIYNYHAKSLGWGDIGYHFLVDKCGGVWEGRQGSLTSQPQGAHVRNLNDHTFGVSMLGNYEEAEPTTAGIEAMGHVIAWKFQQLGISYPGTMYTPTDWAGAPWQTHDRVSAHRDFQANSCPGQFLYSRLSSIRAVVQTGGIGPRGEIDNLSATETGVNVRGWAVDEDSPAANVQIHVYIGGPSGQGEGHVIAANKPRADINTALNVPGDHGYEETISTSKRGFLEVYIYAINAPGTPGVNTEIGHRTVAIGVPDGMVYRLANGSARIYTADRGEASGLVGQFGYTYEGTLCKSAAQNSHPIYRVASGSARIYTEQASERDGLIQNFGYKSEGIGWYVADDAAPVYRVVSGSARILTASIDEAAGLVKSFGYTFERVLFGADTRNLTPVYDLEGQYQFLTADLGEMFGLIKSYGFTYHGVAFNASKTPTSKPVYRLFGTYRFYTTDAGERDGLVKNFGFSYEKIAFYAPETGGIPVTRLYGSAGRYWTTSASKVAQMRTGGWSDEGIKFQAVS